MVVFLKVYNTHINTNKLKNHWASFEKPLYIMETTILIKGCLKKY